MSKVVKGIFGGVAAAFMGGKGGDGGALAALQAQQQARIEQERRDLEAQNAAGLRARSAGKRGLLAFVDNADLGTTLGG